MLAKGEQALFLVPEIALTSQLVLRLKHYFGDQIAVYHSKFSPNERVEIWNRVLQNSERSRVVIGARSFCFCHSQIWDWCLSMKSTNLLTNNLILHHDTMLEDAAIVLANLHNAKTILGSATPSIESYFNAVQQKKYGYVSLTKRYNDVILPDIELVDLKDKHKRKRMNGHFSDRLNTEMKEALEDTPNHSLSKQERLCASFDL